MPSLPLSRLASLQRGKAVDAGPRRHDAEGLNGEPTLPPAGIIRAMAS